LQLLLTYNKKHLKNVGPIRHCEPLHATCFTMPFTRCHYCRTPPLSHAVKIGRSIAEMLQFFVFSRWPPPPSWFVEIAKFYWLFGWRGLRRIFVPNFVKIGQLVAKILRFLKFSRWQPPPSWIVEFTKFYWLSVCGGAICIIVPNFVKIGQSVAKILRFFDFSRWRPSAILDLFGVYLDHQHWVFGGLHHTAKFGYDRCSSFYKPHAHRCPQRRQRQRVTEGTAIAPWNGPQKTQINSVHASRHTSTVLNRVITVYR